MLMFICAEYVLVFVVHALWLVFILRTAVGGPSCFVSFIFIVEVERGNLSNSCDSSHDRSDRSLNMSTRYAT